MKTKLMLLTVMMMSSSGSLFAGEIVSGEADDQTEVHSDRRQGLPFPEMKLQPEMSWANTKMLLRKHGFVSEHNHGKLYNRGCNDAAHSRRCLLDAGMCPVSTVGLRDHKLPVGSVVIYDVRPHGFSVVKTERNKWIGDSAHSAPPPSTGKRRLRAAYVPCSHLVREIGRLPPTVTAPPRGFSRLGNGEIVPNEMINRPPAINFPTARPPVVPPPIPKPPRFEGNLPNKMKVPTLSRSAYGAPMKTPPPESDGW